MSQKQQRDQDVAELTTQKPKVSEAFHLQQPVVRKEEPPLPQEHLKCCGNCPGWKRQHPLAPYGQCLPAIRYLGAPMYTPDLGSCSWDAESIEKALQRR